MSKFEVGDQTVVFENGKPIVGRVTKILSTTATIKSISGEELIVHKKKLRVYKL